MPYVPGIRMIAANGMYFVFVLDLNRSPPRLLEQVAWFCLPKLGIALVSIAEAAAADDSLDVAEDGDGITSPRRGTRQGDNAGSPSATSMASWTSPPTIGHEEAEGTMTEPLLKGAAPPSS